MMARVNLLCKSHIDNHYVAYCNSRHAMKPHGEDYVVFLYLK